VTAARLAVALVATALASGGAAAAPWRESPQAEAAVRADVGRALAVDAGNVVEARVYDVPGGRRVARVYVGRYRERAGARWEFPVVVVDFHRKAGWFLSHVTLGSAATRVELLGLVDLDAARTDVAVDNWEGGSEAPVARRRRWPALVLAVERQPQAPHQIDLVIVSLRTPDRPAVVLERPLVVRYADVSDAEMRAHPRPAGMILGHRMVTLRLERRGKVRRAVAREVSISSRWNGCLPPEPYTVTLVLGTGRWARYQEPAGAPPPPIPCH
jgi:hypothetical protein